MIRGLLGCPRNLVNGERINGLVITFITDPCTWGIYIGVKKTH